MARSRSPRKRLVSDDPKCFSDDESEHILFVGRTQKARQPHDNNLNTKPNFNRSSSPDGGTTLHSFKTGKKRPHSPDGGTAIPDVFLMGHDYIAFDQEPMTQDRPAPSKKQAVESAYSTHYLPILPLCLLPRPSYFPPRHPSGDHRYRQLCTKLHRFNQGKPLQLECRRGKESAEGGKLVLALTLHYFYGPQIHCPVHGVKEGRAGHYRHLKGKINDTPQLRVWRCEPVPTKGYHLVTNAEYIELAKAQLDGQVFDYIAREIVRQLRSKEYQPKAEVRDDDFDYHAIACYLA